MESCLSRPGDPTGRVRRVSYVTLSPTWHVPVGSSAPVVLNALGQENVMKQVAGAVAALALAGSLLLAAPAAASPASLTIQGGASGCCTEMR